MHGRKTCCNSGGKLSRHIALQLTVTLIAMACGVAYSMAQNTEPRDKFWTFIRENKDRIERSHESIGSDAEALAKFVTLIGDPLSTCCPGLVHEFGRSADGVFELIISADGLRDNAATVAGLVGAAPKLPGWRVIAFRPRSLRRGLILHYEGRAIDPSKVWYSLQMRVQKPDITLWFETDVEVDRSQLMGPAFILLDMAIGEHDVMMKLGQIDALSIGSGVNRVNLKPLGLLADEIDRIFLHRR